jgi:hypothetical protein
MTLRILAVAAILSTTLSFGQTPALGQSPDAIMLPGPGSPSSPSDVRSLSQTPDEIRIARARYRGRQRVARLEHNLWMGYEPLRPQWSSVPTMTSRYAPPRTYYIPVYVYH